MYPAEQRIAEIRAAYLARTLEVWRGYEREFLIEATRSLDETAFAFSMAPNREELKAQDAARRLMQLGAASAYRPFLESLKNSQGGVPWAPATSEFVDLVEQHLINCGHLAIAQRTAAMERYGLAKATFHKDDHLILEVQIDDDDFAELRAGVWLGEQARQRLADAEAYLAQMKEYISVKMDSYVSVDHGWFIRYDPSWEMMDYHRNYAAIYAAGTLESDAIPRTAVIGGRPFEEWIAASLDALGRVLHHIACSTRLRAKTSNVQLRNLLTVFARKDDIAAVWHEAGATPAWADQIIPAFSLDAETAEICERDHELPVPYYIDLGRDFSLLPMFGGLMNPYSGMLAYLRRKYRSDWDRVVGGREEVFRSELRELFAAPRYRVPSTGFRLRRSDGTMSTDADAIVADDQTGDLALVQLKWLDLYGRSLAERNSRRANLLKANEWVERVSVWVSGRSCKEVGAALGVPASGSQAPTLIVIARHVARFSGEAAYDKRAHWASWPSLMRARTEQPEANIAELLTRTISRDNPKRWRPKGGKAYHQLPSLKVEIRVC